MGPLLAVLLSAATVAPIAQTVTLECQSASSRTDYFTIDMAAGTVTDDYGTWPAAISDRWVSWKSRDREGFSVSNMYDRERALWSGPFAVDWAHCSKASPRPF